MERSVSVHTRVTSDVYYNDFLGTSHEKDVIEAVHERNSSDIESQNSISEQSEIKNHPTVTVNPVASVDHLPAQVQPVLEPEVARSPFRGWVIEFVGLSGALLSILAIVAILKSFDKKNVKELPYGIELSSVLAIFSKATELTIALVVATCLGQIMWMRYRSRPRPLHHMATYDAASRGPRGQISFLLQRGHSIKGYLGVALALLTLAVGPFTQQTLGIDYVHGPASLARCTKTNYTRAFDAMYNATHIIMYDDINTTDTHQDLILQRLNNDCGTGECGFPTYASLGICGRCVNASDQVRFDCSTRTDRANGSVYGCRASLNDVAYVLNYTDTIEGRPLASMGRNVRGSALGSAYGSALSYDFSSLYYSKGDILHAASCVLYYCVRTHNSNVSYSFLNDNITSVWSDPNAVTPLGDILYNISSTVERAGPGNDTVLTPPQSEWARMNLAKPTNFTIDWYTDQNLKQYLAAAFSGTHYLNTTNVSISSVYTTKGPEVLVTKIYNHLWAANSSQQNMTTAVNAMALVMTNALRSTCARADFVNGTSYNVAVVLNVAWLWITFPIALTALACLLLIATMAETRRRRSVLWKTSLIPLLFHGMGLTQAESGANADNLAHGPDVSQGVSSQMSDELDEMVGIGMFASGTRVQLKRGRNGKWQLVKENV